MNCFKSEQARGMQQSVIWSSRKKPIFKPQRVQNAVARLIIDVAKYSHITPVLLELRSIWLSVALRKHFKY